MAEFWEENFKNKQKMWGDSPADCVLETVTFFQEKNIKTLLVPGFGYGRNAKPFLDHGIKVTGIEISQTAIHLAKSHVGEEVKIFHGSVNDMPFDQHSYGGIFCYALLHLLNKQERAKLIRNCYEQLQPGGYMVFITLSTHDARFGKGKKITENLVESSHGVKLFFYDKEHISQEFSTYGLLNTKEINEPINNPTNKPSQKFWQISCKK